MMILNKTLHSKIFPVSFCLFVVSVSDVLHFQVTIEFFLYGNGILLNLCHVSMYKKLFGTLDKIR